MTSAGYAAPQSLSDAVALLGANPSARLLAGGTGLLVAPSRAQLTSSMLVDLRKVPGLSSIESGAQGLKIGAMTTLRTLAASDAARSAHPALAAAVLLTSDSQTRSRATVGGSIGGRTSGDTDIAALLIALGASVEITGPGGSRTMPVEDVMASPLGREDIITSVTVPPSSARTATAYETQRHPATLTPLVGVAASVTLGDKGAIVAARVGLVGATDNAVRLLKVEQVLQGLSKSVLTGGQAATDGAIRSAASVAGQGLTVRGDLFGSAAYRAHLVAVLTVRAVSRAARTAAG